MARIIYPNIREISTIVLEGQRLKRRAGDALAVDPEVLAHYQREGFARAPTTEAEWQAAGKPSKGWNGKGTSFPIIETSEDGTRLDLAVMRTPSFVGRALQELHGRHHYEPSKLKNKSPRIANVSGLALVEGPIRLSRRREIPGGLFLVGQVKRNGQIHGAYAAGEIEERDLTNAVANPNFPYGAVGFALRRETDEEVGGNLTEHILENGVPGIHLVDEAELGSVNVVLRRGRIKNRDLMELLKQYQPHDEVPGITLIPTDIPYQETQGGMCSLEGPVYLFGRGGAKDDKVFGARAEGKEGRPYLTATLKHIQQHGAESLL